MPRSTQATKNKILSAGYDLLYREGFNRVSMDAIAAAAGITKRTLYQHFPSKDQLVAAMLEHHHRHALVHIQNWGNAPAETPSDLVSALFSGLFSWASDERWLGSGFTRLTMELADLPGHPAREAARLHKHAVEDWLVDELERLGASRPGKLAKQIVLLVEGCISLTLIHRDTSYVEMAAEAAIHLVQTTEA